MIEKTLEYKNEKAVKYNILLFVTEIFRSIITF